MIDCKKAIIFLSLISAFVPSYVWAGDLAIADVVGNWEQKDPSAKYSIKKADEPNSLRLTIPSEFIKLPNTQEYVLIHSDDSSFKHEKSGDPTITLSFRSNVQADLLIEGRGINWSVYESNSLTKVIR